MNKKWWTQWHAIRNQKHIHWMHGARICKWSSLRAKVYTHAPQMSLQEQDSRCANEARALTNRSTRVVYVVIRGTFECISVLSESTPRQKKRFPRAPRDFDPRIFGGVFILFLQFRSWRYKIARLRSIPHENLQPPESFFSLHKTLTHHWCVFNVFKQLFESMHANCYTHKANSMRA